MPKVLPLATVVRVMQGLLAERVPIRNVRAIVEALAEAGPRTPGPAACSSRQVRVALGRQIVQDIVGLAEELPVITLEPELERLSVKRPREFCRRTGSGARAGRALATWIVRRPRSVKNVAVNRRCC